MIQMYNAFRFLAAAYLFACFVMLLWGAIEMSERQQAEASTGKGSRQERRHERAMFAKIALVLLFVPGLALLTLAKELGLGLGLELMGFDRSCAPPTFEWIGNWIRGYAIDRSRC